MYDSEKRNLITPYAFGNELGWLRAHARDATYVVMIGAGPGVMAMAMMEGNPDLNLLVIDNKTCYYTKRHLEDAGIYGVQFVVADSSEYGKDYAGPKLDLLIVDGDHTQEGVTKDISTWFRHVRPGGLIFFHDYKVINDDTTNGVRAAIETSVKDRVLYGDAVDYPGISIVFRKKNYA